MKNSTTIWADKEDKVGIVIDAYSDGEYYVRLELKGHSLNSLSLYLNVEQARKLQTQLLDVAMNSKYEYKKGKMPNFFSKEYHKEKEEKKAVKTG